jgi:hypothetical protein
MQRMIPHTFAEVETETESIAMILVDYHHTFLRQDSYHLYKVNGCSCNSRFWPSGKMGSGRDLWNCHNVRAHAERIQNRDIPRESYLNSSAKNKFVSRGVPCHEAVDIDTAC